MSSKNKFKWYAAGLHFECTQCSRCCSGPGEGYIWVTRPEIKFIADFLKMPAEQLRRKYLKREGLRTTIIEQPITKDCIFLRKSDYGKKCMIYPVRPNQCRTWPFWPGNLTTQACWNKETGKCAGINCGKLYSFDEIEKIRHQKKWWSDD